MKSMLNFVAVLFVAGFLAKIECADKTAILNVQPVKQDDPQFFNTVYEKSLEMLENDIFRNMIIKVLKDVKEIMDSETALEILTGISATTKVIFSNAVGHQTIEATSDGVTNILIDDATAKSIKAGVTGIEDVLSLDNTLKLAELEHAAFKEIVSLKQTPQAISIIGSGFRKHIDQAGINDKVRKSFNNLVQAVKRL